MSARKISQTQSDLSLWFLAVASGHEHSKQITITEPDYERYRQGKQKLWNMNLPSSEYNRKLYELARECNV
jgi:hypothetical protein